jgi:4-hydroxy-tetrahydrodipicolinate synthase
MSASADFTLSGVIPPIITPLTPTGDIDTAGLSRLVSYMIDAGVSGVFVLGSSGEGPWLTGAEREEIITAAVEAAAGRVPVLVGVIEPGPRRTAEAVRLAEGCGAAAVVVASPYYFEAGPPEQIRQVETVAAATRLPIVLYNIPPTTHNLLHPDTVRQLLDVEQVIGIKDSGGNMDHFIQLLALRELRPEFKVLQGAEQRVSEAMRAGADGAVPGMGNLTPGWFCELVAAANNGRFKEADAIQARINSLWPLHTHGFWLACLKYAASVLGFGSGRTVGHAILPEPARAAIRELMEEISDGEKGD